jgi:hypothetical protein
MSSQTLSESSQMASGAVIRSETPEVGSHAPRSTGLLSVEDDSGRPPGVLRLAGGDATVPSLAVPLTDGLLVARGRQQWTSPRMATE